MSVYSHERIPFPARHDPTFRLTSVTTQALDTAMSELQTAHLSPHQWYGPRILDVKLNERSGRRNGLSLWSKLPENALTCRIWFGANF